MAHELTLRADGRAEMAFVGETPWHGLGQPVTQGASIGVWQKEAGMDWEALEATPMFSPANHQSKATVGFRAIPDSKVIYRSDTHDPLAIMGAGYQIVQPKEVLEFFRDLTEVGGWHIHTAGTLRGGRKLWAMASNGQFGAINPKGPSGQKDVVKSNLLLATSLDGSMKTTAALTAVRVVCANTLALALQDGGQQIRVSHKSVFDASVIKRALGVAESSFEVFMAEAREMANTPVDLEEARDLLAKIFVQTAAAGKPSLSWLGDLSALRTEPEPKDSRVITQVLGLFEGAGRGASLKGSKGTRWGLFNAVTQHVDYGMGRSDDTRLDSAWFGRGNGFKQEAFDLLTV